MRGEERRREEVEWRGYETRPDGLACSEKGIAAGAYGVQQEKERSTEMRERETLRGDQAPAVRMEGSYSSS